MLPKPYLSYSAYHLWKTNRDGFRRKYYEGEKSIETTETRFGKWYAEQSEKVIDSRYSLSEHVIEVPFHGTVLHGRLDKFDPIRYKFLDEKTGHSDSKGKAPWNKVKVAKHTQLVFYSLLIKEKYGIVDPVCHLIWLETKWHNRNVTFGGHELTELGKGKNLKLTGKIKRFTRRVSEWERKKLKVDLVITIDEIKKDYEEYRTYKSDVLSGKVIIQEVAKKQEVL